MMMPLVKRLLASGCALLLAATLSTPAHGAFFHLFGQGCGYGSYSTSYGGYGASCGGCGSCGQCCGSSGYSTGYRGFGYGYYTPSFAAYAPSFAAYAPSYCAPSSCGSASCGSACGGSCDPCGVSYGGFSCGTCGVASCGGGCGIASNCGISTIGCAPSDCGTGIVPAVGKTEPENQNQPYSGQATPPTYDDRSDARPDDFQQPARPTPPSNRSVPPTDTTPRSGSGDVLPPGTDNLFPGGNDGGGLFDREAQKPPADEQIRQQTDHAPADMEPTEGDETDDAEPSEIEPSDDADAPADVRVRPLDIETEVAAGVTPNRRRAHYAVRFHAPRVARLDVKPSSKWSPVEPATKLAATK